VSYNDKHNEANTEHNRDGTSDNRSWNCGAEGPTEDPEVLNLRARQQRNFIATMLLSQGVPMILHGDELGRTQQGNNNVYCQDSELSWVKWDEVDQPLMEFTAAVNRLRAAHPTFRRSTFFDGRPVRRLGKGEKLPDIVWLNEDGTEMLPEDWGRGFGRTIGAFLNGDGIQGRDDRGRQITDVNFLLYFNAHDDDIKFTLPAGEFAASWDMVINTAGNGVERSPLVAGSVLKVTARSMTVLRARDLTRHEPNLSIAPSLAVPARGRTPEAATQSAAAALPAAGTAASPGRRARRPRGTRGSGRAGRAGSPGRA
jgi:glycogen operon protein